MAISFGVVWLGALLHLIVAVSVSVGRESDAGWHEAARLTGWLLIMVGSGALALDAV